jgi:hypothetical protein
LDSVTGAWVSMLIVRRGRRNFSLPPSRSMLVGPLSL